MNMPLTLTLYRRREGVARLGTVMLGIVVLIGSQTLVMQHEESVKEEPISLVVISPPIAPEQIIVQPAQKMQPPKQKIIEQPQEVMPVADSPAPALPVLARENPAPAKIEPQITRNSNGAAEGQFAQDVRSRIERRKIYPDTARDLGMEGEVEVLYELDRAGSLIRAEVVSSSGYKLLDQAALKAVKAASYKSFPEDAWVGSGSKEFRTRLVFSINQ